MMRPCIRVCMILAFTLLIAGCERGTRDLDRWVADVRQRPADPIEPIPAMRTPDIAAYEAFDLRDPFTRARAQPEEGMLAGDGIRPDLDRRREYLEGFPLDTLAMVGTIIMEDTSWALISDNENVVHRIREGNYMGQNHGRVHRVLPDRVELVELVPDGATGWLEREAQIALAESRPLQRRRR